MAVSEQLAQLYLDDFKAHARDCLYIRDHTTASIVPLELNRGQAILDAVAEKMKKERGYVRVIFLKSRRFGGSTYVEGRFYSKTSTRPNRNCFIVAHEKESTNTLFEMAKLMQERNPIAPAVKHSNEKVLKFDRENGRGLKSEYRLASARNLDAGRSQGIHYLHCSEEAFWPDSTTLLNSLLQCLPEPPAPHEVFRESTANGFGNTFQSTVFAVYDGGKHPYYTQDGITYAWSSPGSDWVLVFIPWFVHERYSKPFESEKQREAFVKEKIEAQQFYPDLMEWGDSTAKKLMRRFDLTHEQIHWREWAIENKIEGTNRTERERIFQQEYPATVEEAFLTRGSNVYSKDLCDLLESNCKDPIAIGEPVDRAGQTKIKLHPFGKLSIWERPQKGDTYFITVDAGGGIKPSHEAENKEPDPTCIDVWSRRTGRQVAQWHGHIDYGMIANVTLLVGRMYGNAKACVELMNHGFTVVKDLKELKYPLYEAKPGEPGFLTTKSSKPVMVDDLGEMARNGDLQIMSKASVSEMRTFVEKSGKYGAESGCHDDRVMSAAMASQMMRLLPSALKSIGSIGFSNIVSREEGSASYQEVYAG
jgi:hypothetical protein